MNSTTVLYVLDLLATVGVPVWLDGGWGVDALLGRITRSHDDLDLVLTLDDLTRVVEVLVRNGFAAGMDTLIPGVRNGLTVSPQQSPPGWTWHHDPYRTGIMQLVPRLQQGAEFLQQLFHPGPGGSGGYALWR